MWTIAKSRQVAVIAVGFLASIAAYTRLPGPHLAAVRGFGLERALIAFFLPTTATVTCALLRRIWTRDSIRDRDTASEATYEAIIFRIVLFVITIHAIVLASLLDLLPNGALASRIVVVLVGLVLIGIGNLLPRTRPNLAIGIRTSKTLTDRRIWIQTHRTGGYIVVGLGIVIVVAGAWLSSPTLPQVIGAVALIAIAMFLAAYRRIATA